MIHSLIYCQNVKGYIELRVTVIKKDTFGTRRQQIAKAYQSGMTLFALELGL